MTRATRVTLVALVALVRRMTLLALVVTPLGAGRLALMPLVMRCDARGAHRSTVVAAAERALPTSFLFAPRSQPQPQPQPQRGRSLSLFHVLRTALAPPPPPLARWGLRPSSRWSDAAVVG